MGLIVQKFGGSSVRDAERVMNVAQIVTDTYRAGNDVVKAIRIAVFFKGAKVMIFLQMCKSLG